MKYNFDEEVERRGSYSTKWDCGNLLKEMGLTERFDGSTIPVFTADMDFHCAKPIQDALARVVEHNVYGYTAISPHDTPEYYDAIINWFKRRNHWEIQPEEIVYVNGTVEAVKQAILAFTKVGDGVLINRPIYTPFTSTILNTHRTVVNSQLVNSDGYYTVDFEDFEQKAADDNTKLFILCNPHNPTGRTWTPDELTKMAQICEKHHVLIVADEIHGDLVRRDTIFTPLATLTGYRSLITCTAVNKTFNLAGLHATNLVIPDPGLREQFKNSCGIVLPSPFTVAAVIAAYNEGEEWLDQVKEYLDDSIDFVLEFLKERMPKVKCRRPEGTYILWMDFSAYCLSAEEIRRKIYVDANMLLESGPQFDPEFGEGFERICVPTRRALLNEAFTRIADQFEGL